jgi:hypothetical protein
MSRSKRLQTRWRRLDKPLEPPQGRHEHLGLQVTGRCRREQSDHDLLDARGRQTETLQHQQGVAVQRGIERCLQQRQEARRDERRKDDEVVVILRKEPCQRVAQRHDRPAVERLHEARVYRFHGPSRSVVVVVVVVIVWDGPSAFRSATQPDREDEDTADHQHEGGDAPGAAILEICRAAQPWTQEGGLQVLLESPGLARAESGTPPQHASHDEGARHRDEKGKPQRHHTDAPRHAGRVEASGYTVVAGCWHRARPPPSGEELLQLFEDPRWHLAPDDVDVLGEVDERLERGGLAHMAGEGRVTDGDAQTTERLEADPDVVDGADDARRRGLTQEIVRLDEIEGRRRRQPALGARQLEVEGEAPHEAEDHRELVEEAPGILAEAGLEGAALVGDRLGEQLLEAIEGLPGHRRSFRLQAGDAA